MGDPLELFSPHVASWFRSTFGTPTPPQATGWPAIARGDHTLILAPTGSGKTLAAFLWGLDVLFRELRETPEPERRTRGSAYEPGVRIVYVSPLKALNNDVERNLQLPLAGIRAGARAGGDPLPAIRVAVRTGDTPSGDRERMVRRPPQVLITTPESLYLMATAERARQIFATVHTVIVDEIHTLVGTKRGAHLALTLERVGRLATGPVQRVGLSATVRPLEEAARFLGGQEPAGGPREVAVVDAGYRKPLDLEVITPIEDFRELPGNSVWTAIIPEVVRQIDAHRTTLIFCNSRRLAERTADRLNEQRLFEKTGQPPVERRGGVGAEVGIFAAGVDAGRLEAAGLQPIRAHHGSMSREARLAMEGALKGGTLPALVATSSLELGIDVGEIDLVAHLQSPKSVGSGLQRVGRSGHLVGQTSVGRIYTTFVEDVMEAAAVAHGMLRGEIETTHTPENPLDVLAQQILAMTSAEDWELDDMLALVRGAYPYRNLAEATFRGVVEMLSGKYPEQISRHLQARLSWDRVNNRLAALPGSRTLAIRSGGTIPDRGSYRLVLPDRRSQVGELDEEFVFETRVGDTFLLGSQVWRALEITEDRIVAEPAPGETPRMPFWRGDAPWRPYDLGRRIGQFRRRVADAVQGLAPAELARIDRLTAAEVEVLAEGGEVEGIGPERRELVRFLRRDCALDRNSIVVAIDYVVRQLQAAGGIASDRTIVVELFEDALGEPRMVVHSPFGGRVNGPWAIALAGAMRTRLGIEAQINSGDDGFMLRFASADVDPPSQVVREMSAAEAKERLLAELPGSPVFGAQFRMNAARALLLPRERAGKRTPLWLSRLRAKDLMQAVGRFDDFPIVLETYRDCLRDVMDLDGLTAVLEGIERGEIGVLVHEAEVPSPVAVGLDRRFALQYVYEYDAPRGERQLAAALNVNRGLLAELLQDGSLAELLRPEAVAEVAARVGRTAPDWRARTAEELAQVLFELGDLSTDEIGARVVDERWHEWLGRLAGAGRIVERELGGRPRWVHAERLAEYERLAEDPIPVLARWLSHAGPTPASSLAGRYGLTEAEVIGALERSADAVAGPFAAGGGQEWVDRRNLEQMHHRTLTLLRREVQPVPVAAYAELLRRWQHVDDRLDGDGALNRVLQQLRGVAVPGVAWERDVLPARLADHDAAELAERCQSGEAMWVAEGGRDPRRARVRFFFRGEGGIFLPRSPAEAALTELGAEAREVYEQIRGEGAALLPDLVDGTGLARATVQAALVELVLAGLVTNDTLAALRAVLGYEPPAAVRRGRTSTLAQQLAELLPRDRPRPLTRYRLHEARRRARMVVQSTSRAPQSGWLGRWSLVHRPSLLGKALPDDERATRQARQLLARWGVVTRAALEREGEALRWEELYPVLARLEARGEVRRGYFVEGLPGLQFALPEVVEQVRTVGAELRGAGPGELEPTVLSAVDPAQLFGTEEFGGPLRFPRVPSSAVASVGGAPVAVMEDSGSAVTAVPDHPELIPALRALGRWWAPRVRGHLKVERFDGEPVLGGVATPLLEAAGFVREYGGMVWSGRESGGAQAAGD